MTVRWALTERLSPLLQLFPPWWRVRLYARLCGNHCQQGQFNGRTVRRTVAPHNFQMDLRLDDWMERMAAFIRVYYEIEVTATLHHLLRPGDIFVDVGTNVGFITLTAARLVGPAGRVLAIEPHGELLDRLEKTVVSNGITNVTCHRYGLGERDGTANLRIDDHHGAASMRHDDPNGVKVEIRTGASLLKALPPDARAFVKIDVEGYEERVVRGFGRALLRPRTAFLIEITDTWLRQQGGSADSLFTTMHDAGYEPYRPSVTRSSGLQLQPLDSPLKGVHQYDVLFVRPQDNWQGCTKK